MAAEAHDALMDRAIVADGEAFQALFAGRMADAHAALEAAAVLYRASWEQAPPRSFGRLVAYLKSKQVPGTTKSYFECTSMLVFSALGLAVTYGIQRLQGLLPLNPNGLGAVAPDLAFNTAAEMGSRSPKRSASTARPVTIGQAHPERDT